MKYILPIIFTFHILAVTIPRLSGPVVDKAKIFKNQDKQRLEKLIRTINNSGGPQLQILTVNSLQGTSIEDYSIRVVEKWKLGGKKEDNGLLIMMAMEDRKVRIEVGQGLEPIMTDATSNLIINQIMVPQFKSGRFYQGFQKAIYAIKELTMDGKPIKIKNRNRSGGRGVNFNFLFIILFVPVFLRSLVPKKLRTPFSLAASLIVAVIGSFILYGTFKLILVIFMTFFGFTFSLGRQRAFGLAGRSGFGAGGFGTGGGWSGGGGGFSGGGSSGSW